MSLQSLMIRASAGSGKTYQLSNRFLALLAAGAEPSSMIALTFTRKAAGEFADRILSRLAEGSLDAEQAVKLAGELADTLQGNAESKMPGLFDESDALELDVERFRELLHALVGDMHRVSLGTLDSFFVRIAKRFPYELGLADFQLLEEDAQQAEKDRVLARIFREVPERQKEAFLGAFRLATHGKEHNRLCDLLDDFLDSHHERFLKAPQREQWGNTGLFWPEGCPWPDLGDFSKAARDVVALLDTVKTKKKPHATWVKSWTGVVDWFAAYQGGDGRKMPSIVSRTLPLLEDLANGGAVDNYSRIEHEVEGPLARAMADLVGGYLRAEVEARATRTEGLWSLLWAYESIYAREVRRRGRLGFADVTNLLADGGLTTGGRARIESRLDARYRQWMLDEFQDTSRSQWEVLEGLLDEAILDPEGERSLFVVGDTKQGIYGWRGGEPRLFDDLLARPGWKTRMNEWGMETSWRSKPEVLDLVNAVCDPAVMRGRFPDAAVDRWKYEKHRSAVKGQSRGYAVVVDTEADDQEEEGDEGELTGVDAALRDLLAEVRPIERGLSCAVLVRSNRKARLLVDFLRQEFPSMPVEMDAEVEPALDNPLGAAILDLFRWLAHPADQFALKHVMRSPLGSLFEGETSQVWNRCREQVVREGMAGLLGGLVDGLREAGELNRFLEDRMDSIMRAALDYDESGGRELGEWIKRLESLKRREYSAAGALQVMTVHKAKGLEFDMVVLPDLGNSVFDDPSKSGALEFKDDEGVIEGILLSPGKEILEADPGLRECFERWRAEQCYERFCNLYVGLTRAKEATYVLLPKAPKNPSSERRFDLWIRASVGESSGETRWDGRNWNALYQEGDASWFAPSKVREEAGDADEATGFRLGDSVGRRARMTPSGEKKKGAVKIALSPTGMKFGSEVHAAFEAVGWVEEAEPVLPESEAGVIVKALLEKAEVSGLFERRGREVELFREQQVEAILDGKWLSGVIDRLHVFDGGKSVEIIDFKTDAVNSEEELLERYTGQMESYQKVMSKVYPGAEVRCLLVSTKLGRVVEVAR